MRHLIPCLPTFCSNHSGGSLQVPAPKKYEPKTIYPALDNFNKMRAEIPLFFRRRDDLPIFPTEISVAQPELP